MADKIPTISGFKASHNLDINVPDEILRQFPALIPLFKNQEIKNEFTEPETSANLYKFLFNFTGLTSLIFIIIVLLFTIWRYSALSAGFQVQNYFVWVSAILGILSLIVSIASYFLRFQYHWLYSRFTLERLRQFMFQQLLDGNFIELATTNKEQFDLALTERWHKFKFDFVLKKGAMNSFTKAADFKLFVNPNLSGNSELSQQIFEAYFVLRLGYQEEYFSFKQEELIDLDEWTKSLAKISLLIAGVLALAELIILLIHNSMLEKQVGWIIGALAVSSALVSGGVRVFRNARAISEEAERYISKWVVLKILSERFSGQNSTPEKRLEVMIETERVCIEELREFIRAFNKSDYLL